MGEEGNPRGKKEDRRIKERKEWMLGERVKQNGHCGQEGLRKKIVEEVGWRDGERRNKGESFFFHL